jgi:tetratricopeptide (TPR) repeat protein
MFAEAQAEIDKAIGVDPQSLIYAVVKGLIYYQGQDWHAAQAQFGRAGRMHKMQRERLRRAGERVPPDTIFYGQALAYVGLGRLEEARLAARNASRSSHGHRVKLALLAYVYILLNRRDEAQEILRDITREEQENRLPFHVALIHAGLCQKDPEHAEEHAARAFRFLHLAVERRDYWSLWLAVDPRLEVLRRDRARFDSLLRNARLPPLGIL